MKKTNVLIVFTLLAILMSSFVGKEKCEKSSKNDAKSALLELQHPFKATLQHHTNYLPLCLEEISFIELEAEIDLGFDTAEYLPIGFNPYEGMIFNIDDIDYITLDEEIDLGFDTAEYLPIDFDAYEGMGYGLDDIVGTLDLDDIIYLVEDEEIELGFDTQKYLPKGFDAYAK
tara:strand:- start:3161 stop:3679 length:519 start_codon:yes stop_codon:yes gene_type:complete